VPASPTRRAAPNHCNSLLLLDAAARAVVNLIAGIEKNMGAVMFEVRTNAIIGAGLAVCLLFAPAVAFACSYPGNSPYQLDPDEIGLDQEPPSKVSVLDVYLGRPDDSDDNCWGHSVVYLIIKPATDDRTDAEHMGYVVSKVSGSCPSGFGFNGYIEDLGPVLGYQNEELFLHWNDINDDGSRPLDFTLAVSAVDLAGNQGPPSDPIHIFDPGSPGGCITGGFGDFTPAAIALLLLVLGFRKNRLRRNAVVPIRGTALKTQVLQSRRAMSEALSASSIQDPNSTLGLFGSSKATSR